MTSVVYLVTVQSVLFSYTVTLLIHSSMNPNPHFRRLQPREYNTWNRIRLYMIQFLMNVESSRDLQVHQAEVDKKIVFKHYTPTPESEILAITQNGDNYAYEWEDPVIGLSDKVLEMTDENGQPLACWSVILLFHEMAHAAIHYDKNWNVKFTEHKKPFLDKLDLLKKEDIKPLYLQSAKEERSPVRECIYPLECVICDKYRRDLAGKTPGRPLKQKGKKRKCGF